MIVCPWNALSRYASVIRGLDEAVALVNSLECFDSAVYPLSNGNRVVVMSGQTVPVGTELEAHRQYLDIQYIVKGQEVMGWAPLDTLELVGEFNETKDVGFYTGKFDLMRIGEGYCYVAFPEDGHMPTRFVDQPNDYTKIVVKLKV